MLDDLDVNAYLRLTDGELGVLRDDIGRCLGSAPLEVGVDGRLIVAEDRVGSRFRLVPGGSYVIGLSASEEAAARRIDDPPQFGDMTHMRPIHEVEVRPFLISESPITVGSARGLVGAEAVAEGAGDFGEPVEDGHPARVTKPRADDLARRSGGRLPTEPEWEIAYRGGTRSLFPWGDVLPEWDQLDALMGWDLSGSAALPANGFGLVGLCFGEWTSSPYRASYAEGAEEEAGCFAVRGGGAMFWPWQDQEWSWCASANRMSSAGLFEDRTAAMRVVIELTR